MSDDVLVDLVDYADDGETASSNQVSSRLSENHPELRSLLWLMKEGIVTRSHFYERVVTLSKAAAQ